MFRGLSWNRKTFTPDLMAGLTVALVSIPEGMAYALVAGVDPVYGLFTGMTTTIIASLMGSTSLMIVTLTNALALVTADQLGGLSGDTDPIRALFTLTLLVGVIMFLLGVLKLGSVIRFVSKEVMSGFVFAIALLIAKARNKIAKVSKSLFPLRDTNSILIKSGNSGDVPLAMTVAIDVMGSRRRVRLVLGTQIW